MSEGRVSVMNCAHAANPVTLQIEPNVGVLYIFGGRRMEEVTPCAAIPSPSSRAVRGRESDHLFILLNLSGPASPHLYRELREVVAQTYWSTTGSITAALRRAATAANDHLFRANLRSTPTDRCGGGLICAVLHGDDLFMLQAGSGQVCFLHRGHLECLSREADLPPVGVGPLSNVRLYHAFVASGDALLLSSPTLVQEAGSTALARVLSRVEMQEVLDGLEQIGAGVDFVALVVRWGPPAEALAGHEATPLRPRRRLPGAEELQRDMPIARETRRPPPPSGREVAQPERGVRSRAVRRPGPGLGERMRRSLRSTGQGIAAAGLWLARGMSALFQRMLPGADRRARRPARPPRPVPQENRTVMMAIAIGIPLALAVIVALTYLSFGADARIQGFISQAEQEITLAQAAGGTSEEARSHWENALAYASAALAVRPEDTVAIRLQAQAQEALDRLDGIVRLQPIQVWDFGLAAVPHRLVVHGQTIFVLDPAGGWISKLTLNPARDGVVEHEDAPILVQTGQQVGEGKVGNLVDLVWAEAGSGRQTSGLLILEQGGALVSHDPAWVEEGGAPKLTRSLLGTAPESARVIDSYAGRLYILDADANQIWRHDPRGDVYPDRPHRYFVNAPPKPLTEALDMAIDGNIYVLYQDGQILQFLQGEHQPAFDVRGLPDGIIQGVALAVDPDGGRGAVYVADRGNERVVALKSDGTFEAQFRAAEAFGALEALAVDEAAGRLYVVSGGRLYVAPLP